MKMLFDTFIWALFILIAHVSVRAELSAQKSFKGMENLAMNKEPDPPKGTPRLSNLYLVA